MKQKKSKPFFFVNKKGLRVRRAKKTSIICAVLVKSPMPQVNKSFCAPLPAEGFFKKRVSFTSTSFHPIALI
jgi:hypothetical protein